LAHRIPDLSMSDKDGGDIFNELSRRASATGLAVRGAFYPEPDEFAIVMPPAMIAATIVLLGFTGSRQWPLYAVSAEAADGLPHPLDRWSRRMIGGLASEFGTLAVYPNECPPLPFQKLAARCEPVHQSPIGLLIHVKWGLWHAYRGALVFPRRIAIPVAPASDHPCVVCADRACLRSCPVNAFTPSGFDHGACVAHISSAAGADCRDRGCRARLACPVGSEFQYVEDQARLHMSAFLRSMSPPTP
jgi:hypothetical protein